VHIDVRPANITQDLAYDPATDEFTGIVTSPPGAQTITATVYSGAIVLGTGTATTTVAKHVTATVLIKILDSASPGRTQDHGPIIVSVTATPASPMVGDTIRLEVVATDPEGDPISYQWEQDCVGTFTAPNSAVTDWTSNIVQSCSITAVAAAKGLSDRRHITISVVPAGGEVSMAALFIPAPYVSEFDLAGAGLSCTISRDAPDASCRPAIAPNTVLTATVTFDPMPSDSGGTVVLSDGCSGASTRTALDLPNGVATFSWISPAASGTCLLTATATRETLSDSQRVAIAIQ
jgi:hypothetical protein